MYTECAAKARKNIDLDTGDQALGVVRKQDEVIAIDDDVDDVERDLVRGVFVKADPVDRFSVSGEDNFHGKRWLIRTKLIKCLVRRRQQAVTSKKSHQGCNFPR